MSDLTPALTDDMVERLAGKIDQLIGWAKSGATVDYYLMDRENVDSMRDHVIRELSAALGERVVVELPDDWRKQLEQLEAEERMGAVEAGLRPSAEQRDAFECGVNRATELFESWLPEGGVGGE